VPRGGYRASPFRTPGVPPLPDTLALSRAMRPLRLRVPSHVERVLDEDETVRRIAEQDLWAPAHRPRREPWLDVILVVDDFETMVIWRPAVDALERLLRRQRAFRQVRRVRLREGGEDAPVPVPRVTDGTGRRFIALAEVFLGGLIERDDLHLPAQQRERDPQRIRFEFRFDIRRRLLNTLPDTMVEDVIDALSEVVERRLGRVSDFIALMLDPSAAGKVPLDSDSLPFARVRLQVLRRLSGDYAPLADALEDAIAEWHDRDGAPMALPTDPTPFREPFKDGSGDGPEMIWLPGGTFRMGSPEGVGSDDEHPAHDVTLSHFGVGKYPLTVGEFRRFATAAGYKTEAEQGGGAWVWNHGEYGNKEDAS
jgi:hypothetical protein